MLKRPKRELFVFGPDSDDEEDGAELQKPKTIRYSKILEEETDFWPEENFPRVQ